MQAELSTIIENFFSDTRNMGRRDFILRMTGAAAALLSVPFNFEYAEAKKRPHHSRGRRKSIDYSKIPVPKVGYKPIVKEPRELNVNLSDTHSLAGRIERAYRWRNITRAVENRYGIPKDYLLGMICVESEGDPTKPNSLGDGGVGLIHMQPLMASKYGLELITDSEKLRDFYQGRKLERAIEVHNGELKKLISVDDRFHPIKNIDAAARMLCDLYSKSHNWKKALEGYAGRNAYDSNVLKYVQAVHNKKFMKRLKVEFNERNKENNPKKPLTFDRYMGIFYNLNRNYGLDKYVTLRRYLVK